MVVEPRGASPLTDRAPQGTFGPLAKRPRVERLFEPARKLKGDLVICHADVLHEVRRAVDFDVGPVDRVAQAEASILGAVDPTVEGTHEVGVVDAVVPIKPTTRGVATNLRLARSALEKVGGVGAHERTVIRNPVKGRSCYAPPRMARKGPKLVVVSNRGPYRHEGKERWVRSAGGLVAALDPVLQKRGGVWVSAKQAKDFDSMKVPAPRLEYELRYIALKRSDERGFYEGVSNAVIWPLLHGFPPTIRVGSAPWPNYVNANRAFAEMTLSTSAPSDLIWVQDYHLMLVPGLIRAKRAKARVGWFCHIPWPSPDTFGILPWREEILEGLLGADLLGFHLPEYAEHFRECVERFTPHRVSRDAIEHRGRTVKTTAAPIGVPVDDLQALAVDPNVAREVDRIRQTMGNRKLILCVDRLDYTKGIPERLAAFEGLLRKERAARRRYALIQIMVPSRTDVKAYSDLKKEIDRMVGDINGRHSETGLIPIHYFYRNLSQRELWAHYRAADVAWVTPLRDGMNLVAHEYVTARADGGGVLVLSEFAGAAKHLKAAVLVNPYDVGAMTDAVHRALHMKQAEIRKRMKALRTEVMRLDVHHWADDYIATLEAV